MNNDKEQLDGLEQSFQAVIDNPAFQWMVNHFDNNCLSNRADTMQEKAEKYIAESAVKEFIRSFSKYADGVVDPVALMAEAMLEDENEIDENENIFDITR